MREATRIRLNQERDALDGDKKLVVALEALHTTGKLLSWESAILNGVSERVNKYGRALMPNPRELIQEILKRRGESDGSDRGR